MALDITRFGIAVEQYHAGLVIVVTKAVGNAIWQRSMSITASGISLRRCHGAGCDGMGNHQSILVIG
jgi:hypothetical protein